MLGFLYTVLPLILMKRIGVDKLQTFMEPGASPEISGLRCLLCCASCQPHSWTSSFLMARQLPAVLGNRMSLQRTFLNIALIAPCACPWKKKVLSGQGPGPWVRLSLTHKLLLKLGWRNSSWVLWIDGGGGRKFRIQKGEWMLHWQNKRCHWGILK